MSRISLSQTQAMQAIALPDDLRSELSQLDWRLRWISFVKGAGSLLFASLVLAALFLVADFLMPLPGMVRFGFLAILLSTASWLFYSWLVVPLSRKRRWAELAYLIDRSFPELQERVSSTVELSMLTESQQQFSSEFMVNRLRVETDKKLSRVDLKECLSLNAMAIALAAGVLTTIVLCIPIILNASGYSLLWQRLLTPWANLDSATNLTFLVEQGDRTVPRGDDVFIVAKPAWRYREGKVPPQITLSWHDQQGEADSRQMSFDQRKGAYIGKIPQVLAPLSYVLHSSGARSRKYAINVADRPRLVDVKLLVVPPEYTGMETESHEGAIGTIRAITGSELITEITFEHPVREIQWRWETLRDEPKIEQTPEDPETDSSESSPEQKFPKTFLQGIIAEDGLSARIVARADMSDSFLFRAISFEGLENINEPERLIQIIPDRPPLIEISGSKDPVQVRPDDIIPIDISASDDFGVQELQVVIEHLTSDRESPELLSWSSIKTGDSAREVYDHFDLDLTQFKLEPGEIIGYRAVARDGRPVPGPNETWTSRRVIMINQEVAPLAGQLVEEYYDRIRRQTDAVKNEMTQLRRNVEQQRRELDPKPRDQVSKTVREKKPEWLQKELGLSLKLEELMRKLRERPITNELSRQSAEPALELIDQAASELDQFEEEKTSNPIEMVRDHEKKLREAENMLNRLRNQLDDAERIEQELVQVQQLARRARNLAKNATELSKNEQAPPQEKPADKKPIEDAPETNPLEDLQEEHASLSHDLKDLLKKRPELMQAAKNGLLSDLADIARKAEELAKKQQAITESTEQDQKQSVEKQADLAKSLKQAEEIAEELAAKSESQSENNAAPVFDASPTKKASQEQEEANLGEAKAAIERAKETLKRFMESQKNAKSLPEDTQAAAKQLAEKSEQLAKKVEEHQKQKQGLEKQKQAQKKQAEQKAGQKTDPNQQAQADKKQAEAAEQLNKDLEKNRDEAEKLAEELAGLTQAVAGLTPPPRLKYKQREVAKILDRASDEFAKQTNQSDDRLRESAKSLKSLADQLGDQKKRADKSKPQLEALKKEADNLTKQIEEAAKKGDANALKNLAKKQESIAKRLMHTDAVDQEQQLAKTMQAARKAEEQLKAGKANQAVQAEKEFADQLEKMKKAIEQQAQKEAGEKKTQQATDKKAASNAWEKAQLTEEQKKIRFPKEPGTAEELKKSLEKIAEDQKQLNEKSKQAIAKNAKPEQAHEQKRSLQRLGNEQQKNAHQTERLEGKTALLPRMKAMQAMTEAAKALREGDAEKSKQHQQEAKAQLELAAKQIDKEIADSKPQEPGNATAENKPTGDKPTESDSESEKSSKQQPSSDELAKKLEEKLKAIDQELAKAISSSKKSDPNQPAAKPAGDNQEKEIASQKQLAESLKRLQQSQKKVAEQAKQLAEKAKLEQPDRKKQNQEMQQAAKAAEQASENLEGGKIQQAAQQAKQAAQNMEQANQQASPDEKAQAASKQLAQQQENLAKQIAELSKNSQASRAAREENQKKINAESKQLTEKLKQIAEHSQSNPINDKQTGQKSENLSKQSSQANNQMQKALQESQNSNLQQAAEHSEKAAGQLQQLAEKSADLAQMKRDTLVPEQVGEEATEAARLLDQAEKSLQQAIEQAKQQAAKPETTDSPAASQKGESKSADSQNQGENPAGKNPSQSQKNQQAKSDQNQKSSQEGQQPGQQQSDGKPAAAMEQLAQKLSEAAKSLEQAHQNLQPSQKESSQNQQAQKQKGQGNPSENPADSETGNSTPLTGDEKLTGEILRSALMRDWGQKQGELDANLTDGRRRHIDQEYAPLIQRYFKALAQPEPRKKSTAPKK